MINAIILINCERTKINAIGEQLASLTGITEILTDMASMFDLGN